MDYKVYHQKVDALTGKENWSAIQVTTAAAVCVAVDLFFLGKLAVSGLVKQEDISLEAFLTNQFATPYRQNKRGMEHEQK